MSENNGKDNGTTSASATPHDLLSELSDVEQLDAILGGYPPVRWFTAELLPTIAQFRPHAASWGLVKAMFKDLGGNTRDLEAAVDEWRSLCGPKPAPSAAPPGATPSSRDLALLIGLPDDALAQALPDLVKTSQLSPHDPLLWQPALLERLCAMRDLYFTPTVLAMAQPDALGPDLLFDERLLPRLAAMRNGHLRGTFLPYARRIPGFDARDFLRELHKTQQAHRSAGATPVVVCMASVTAQPITWLWWPYIALGKLTMLDGDPGIGKSLLMTQLAANLSQGHPLPDQEGKPTFATGGPHTTLMLSTEDGLADTLKPRLEEAGADCQYIHVLTGVQECEGPARPFSFQDMPLLERVLEAYQPRLLIIDPIQAYLGGHVDMHRANETRPLLEGLRGLAERYQCAIVCVRHPAKASQGGKAIHRGLGSVDFIGAARTGLFVEQHPTDPGKVLLAQSKSNIGPLGTTLMFTKYEGHFEWCGTSRLSAEMLAGSGRGPDPHSFLEAVFWLEQRLAGGVPVSSETVQQEAVEEGIGLPTLRRAKKALDIRSVKQGEEWTWHLLSPRRLACPAPLHSLATLEPLASLDVLEHLPRYQEVTLMEELPACGAAVVAEEPSAVLADLPVEPRPDLSSLLDEDVLDTPEAAQAIENMEDAQVHQVEQVEQVAQEEQEEQEEQEVQGPSWSDVPQLWCDPWLIVSPCQHRYTNEGVCRTCGELL